MTRMWKHFGRQDSAELDNALLLAISDHHLHTNIQANQFFVHWLSPNLSAPATHQIEMYILLLLSSLLPHNHLPSTNLLQKKCQVEGLTCTPHSKLLPLLE